MHLKRLILTKNLLSSIYRSYVTTVKVNVNSFSSIKVKSKDFFEKENQKVKLTILDDQQKEVNAESLTAIEVQNTSDAFNFKCFEPKNLSIILELPVESSPELHLDLTAANSKIYVEGIQTKKINIDLKAGDILLKNLKSDLIKVEANQGNIATKNLILGKNIELEAEKGVKIS